MKLYDSRPNPDKLQSRLKRDNIQGEIKEIVVPGEPLYSGPYELLVVAVFENGRPIMAYKYMRKGRVQCCNHLLGCMSPKHFPNVELKYRIATDEDYQKLS